uniref:MCTS1 re-initiation and release factor n=1 Tax=Monodelphis domestica TaxID=13616 RepID=A0A5F8GLN0_MONDO
MFKKFDEKESVINCIQLKNSVIKGIKNQLTSLFPEIKPWLNQIIPKKDLIKIVRCHEHIEILTVNGELLFFRQREGPFLPTLRLLHKYPFILPHQQVDKGAIKYVLSGANIMCPGLTSPGAKLSPAEADTIVVSFRCSSGPKVLSGSLLVLFRTIVHWIAAVYFGLSLLISHTEKVETLFDFLGLNCLTLRGRWEMQQED